MSTVGTVPKALTTLVVALPTILAFPKASNCAEVAVLATETEIL